MSGENSFQLSKGLATNAQGEGVSYDFTIDRVYQGRVLTVKFDYLWGIGGIAGTGTTTGTFNVYIYDVTNAVLIQPSAFKLFSNSTTVSDQFQAEFQTAVNSTSYRLIIHCASTDTGGFDFIFDNVQVSPNSYVFGSPVSDWAAYTPTFTGFGTVSGSTGFWRRVGDKVELRFAVTTGTVAASIASFSLPSGLSIDANKLRVTNNLSSATGDFVGLCSTAQAAANIQNNLITAPGTSTTVIYFSQQDGASVNKLIPANGNVAATSTTTLIGEATVPIAGWSSSVQMADSTSTRVVTANAVVSGSHTSSGTQPVQFNTIVYDTHAATTTGTSWAYRAPVSGYYSIQGLIASSTASATNYIYYRNGSIGQIVAAGSSTFNTSTVSGSVFLNQGDTLDIRASVSVTIVNGAITVSRISGPAQIASSETVAASYWLSTNQALTASTTPVNFDSREFDTHSAVTTGAGWVFTAPISGIYSVDCYLNPTTSVNFTIMTYVAGSAYKAISNRVSDYAQGTTLIPLNAGQTLQIRITQTLTVSGGTLTSDTAGKISIHRIGNRG